MNVDKLIKECTEALSPNVRRSPWSILNHGYDALDTEEKLNAYIAAYGEMHVMKCRKALQTFPFAEIGSDDSSLFHINKIEVFDWGCGQGLATLVFLQYLSERNLLHCVRRITLIEPSSFAIKRAVSFVSQASAAHTDIRKFERLIPQNEESLWNDIDCQESTAVHLFSNILDVRSVGLGWLSEMTRKLGTNRYYVCVGPKYGGKVSRIRDFFNYHTSSQVFSDYSNYPAGYTSTTNHPYGIEVISFHVDRNGQLNTEYSEQSEQGIDDLHCVGEECLEGILSEEVVDGYKVLRNASERTFEFFLKPTLGVEKPDFLLLNKSNGVVIVNVCADINNFNQAYRRVEAIKAALFDTYVESLQIQTTINPSIYNCIKTGLYFPNSSADDVRKACELYKIAPLLADLKQVEAQMEEPLCPRHLGRLDECRKNLKYEIDNPMKDNPTRFLIGLTRSNAEMVLKRVSCRGFLYAFYLGIKQLIVSNWHSSLDGDCTISLTRGQKSILANRNQFLRVKGVAGCGKTQLVAYTAVSEHLRTGRKVLIITFNITLREYIKMRILQVPMDFSTGEFEILNYHQFFLSKAKRYTSDREVPCGASDDIAYFEKYKSHILEHEDQYDTVIVDEAQDFISSWFEILRKYFLRDGGRFIVFGDSAQNIYEREYEESSKMPVMRGFSGRWTMMSDRISMRLLNPKIADLSTHFANSFGLSTDSIELNPTLSLFDGQIVYLWLDKDSSEREVVARILQLLDEYKLVVTDTTVLGHTIDFMRELDYVYRRSTGGTTKCTFESKEEFDQLHRRRFTSRIEMDLKKIRRVAKVHFTTVTSGLKFATVQSFKGWESDSVILVIENEEYLRPKKGSHALVYTALTRARKNLIIINKGNRTYDRFFREAVPTT